MSADNLEDPEVDLLIRELSSAPKPAAARLAVKPPAVPAVAPSVVPPIARPFGSLEALRPIAPARRRRTFLSAIALPSLPSFASRPSFPAFPSFSSLLPMPGQVAVVRMCVGLGVLLGSAMPYWPYPKAGVWWLLFYLFAVVMVLIAGVWSARLTWTTRLGVAHVVALCVVLWGITLAAEETLRNGYAPPEAVWFP